MEINKLEAVRINEIEKLILLADDVLKQLCYNGHDYNKKGEPININGSSKLCNEELNTMIYKIIKSKEYFLEDALAYKADTLLVKLEPISSKVIGIFRYDTIQDTVHNDTNYFAHETICDDYLMELFDMRVRDRMIVMAANRDTFK